ncbi:MAG: outer membrane beta-barrel protein [Ignavibacteriales bacterium]
MKKVLLLSIMFFVSSLVFGQYQVGKNTGGAFIGVGGGGLSGTGGLPIGIEYNFFNYEKNIQIGAFAAYSSTSEDFIVGKWKYSNIIIAAQANYHFLPGDKLDPFAGLTLGYDIASSSAEYISGYNSWSGSASSGGFIWSAQAGLNYWFTPKYAAQIRVGYFPYISAGITLAM